MSDEAPAASGTAEDGSAERDLLAGRSRTKARNTRRIIGAVGSIVIVVVIFALVIPRFASYGAVWNSLKTLSTSQLLILLVATALNMLSYYPQMVAAMPGLTLGQAAVNNQTTTTVANVVPGGGAIAVGLSYTIYRSWGFTTADFALTTLLTGIWNTFMKLGLPVVALAILAIEGHAKPALLTAALIGVAILVAAIALFVLLLWKKAFARAIGDGVGRVTSFIRKSFRKPPVTDWGEGAVRFRKQTIKLVAKRWPLLTAATVFSHLALYLVLLLSLRFVGVSSQKVSWEAILGVYAFVRLLSALPLTPGGLGVAELGYIAGLVVAGGPKPEVVAGVLLFRALTYGLQIPLGGFTYIIWRRKRSWMKPVRTGVAAAQDPAAQGSVA